MLERYPTHNGVGIDDDTALLIQGETMTVVGRGSVSFFARDVQTDAIQRVTLSASEKLETSFLLPGKQVRGEPSTMVSME
jgi:cyanophycinase-like exopeptidase